MPYHIAGIDVHKTMLAIAVADVEVAGDLHVERLKVGTSPVQLRALAEWFVEREVEEVVMESTAQYWRPVWEALERYWKPKRRTRTDASPLSAPAKRIRRRWPHWRTHACGRRPINCRDAFGACADLHPELAERSRLLPLGTPWTTEAEFEAITMHFQPPSEDEGFNVVRDERR
jgi:hypothetical protein